MAHTNQGQVLYIDCLLSFCAHVFLDNIGQTFRGILSILFCAMFGFLYIRENQEKKKKPNTLNLKNKKKE